MSVASVGLQLGLISVEEPYVNLTFIMNYTQRLQIYLSSGIGLICT
jgi:hypothetical protein